MAAVGLFVTGLGVIIGAAGIQNVNPVTLFRDILTGQAYTPGPAVAPPAWWTAIVDSLQTLAAAASVGKKLGGIITYGGPLSSTFGLSATQPTGQPATAPPGTVTA